MTAAIIALALALAAAFGLLALSERARRKGTEANGDLRLENAELRDDNEDLDETLEDQRRELLDERDARLQADKDFDAVTAEGDALRLQIAAFPEKCGECGAELAAQVDEILWGEVEGVGIKPPPEVTP